LNSKKLCHFDNPDDSFDRDFTGGTLKQRMQKMLAKMVKILYSA